MDQNNTNGIRKSRFMSRWLPFFVAIAGIILSFLLLQAKYNPRNIILWETNDLWMDLTLSISISLLIATLVALVQIIKQRAQSIENINAALKREINDRVEAEKSNQKLEAALLQGQKLQAIGTLAGGIAHDFNNILYAIIGYTKLVQENLPPDSLNYKNLSKVLEGTQRGQELVSRILAFSRRQHQDYVPINLKQTIEEAMSLLKPTSPASVSIAFNSSINPTIHGNQNQLHQVIINLINNAVDAMDSEGTVQLTLSKLQDTDPVLSEFPDIVQQAFCKLTVTDSGHGMDTNTLKRIFEPFFTTKEVGKGTGLGLSIVHSIIKEHAGRITVSSQLGKGTTFIILLPECKE